MSVEQNLKDNTSNKEVLSDKSKTITGDVYVQDVHKYFGVTKPLTELILMQILARFMQSLEVTVVEKVH